MKIKFVSKKKQNPTNKYYFFSQNNSGGRFIVERKSGIAEYVIIEAQNVENANRRAQDIGLYFDGCRAGRDCHCCGDRWSSLWEEKGNDEPMIYDTPVNEYKPTFSRSSAAIHYMDGTIKWIELKQ
jgi:hypothetical protein